jgi:hypothetical protein
MSYSNYQLNQKINNLQNQINGAGGSQSLGAVMTIGNIASTDLNMNSNNITNLNSITSDTSLTGQITFSQPPHSVTPLLGNDLTTKGYVDSLVGQYSGGYNLYLNYSETVDATYKKLSSTVSNASQQSIITTTAVGTFLLQSFITNPINVTEIPAGLWSLSLYGAVSGIGGILTYAYIVKLKSGANITVIGNSANSSDVNATPTGDPISYNMNLTIPTAISCLITDQIIIEVYYTKTGASVSLYTYFESNFYSFIQTTLNAGTTLLTSDNNWTAENTFNGNLTLKSTLKDLSGDIGTAGQVLSSTGAGTNWISSGTTYVAYTASTTLSTLVNPTLLVIVSGALIGITITIPSGYTIGQKIQIKNNASNSITIATTDTVYTYASISLLNLLTLDSGDVANFYYTGFAWIQYTPSNTFKKLFGNNGCLAGQTNYVSINTSALPQTVSTVINTDMFVFLVGSTALKVLSIPVVTNVGQIMTVKNSASVDVSLAFPSSNVMVFDSLTVVSAVILKSKGTITLYWGGAFWIQTVPSNTMPELTTSGNISSTAGSVSASTTLSAGTTITAGTDITATAGNISSTAGSVSAGTTITAGTGITSTSGNIQASGGNIIGTLLRNGTNTGSISSTGAIAGISLTTSGNISATAGSVSASTTITAGTGIIATSGDITTSSGSISASVSVITPTITPIANTSNLGIATTQSSGILNMGIGNRTKTNGTGEGNINIGTGNNTITSGTVAPTINIGNNTALTNLTEISVGATNTKTTINGALSLGTNAYSTINIGANGGSGAQVVSIYNSRFPDGVGLPITGITPTINQLGYTSSISNTSLISISAPSTLTNLLGTGVTLPKGNFLITFVCTATFTPASNASSMTMSFLLSSGLTLPSVTANTSLIMIGNSTKTTFTFSCIAVNTNYTGLGELVWQVTPSATTTNVSAIIGDVKITYIKIA